MHSNCPSICHVETVIGEGSDIHASSLLLEREFKKLNINFERALKTFQVKVI